MVTADDVVLSDIRDSGRNEIKFAMYVRLGNAVLNHKSLLEAVQVSYIATAAQKMLAIYNKAHFIQSQPILLGS